MLRRKTAATALGMTMLVVAAAAVIGLGVGLGPAGAEEGRECSVEHIAGSWLFATQVGHLAAASSDITALGTMNIDREGNVTGEFDVTVAEVAFGPGNTYWGSVAVNPDCTGTLTFETDRPSERTDSIAILSDNEMWGMSQDKNNLWNYDIRRISGQPHQ